MYVSICRDDFGVRGRLDCRHLFTLLRLADMGAHRRTAKISTEYLASRLDLSQQTASRYLIELEDKGLIRRNITPEGCLIRISESGVKELETLYAELRCVMEKSVPPSITFEGVVFTGMGEGVYYTSVEGYRRQFIEKLGFDPYPGTLNLKLGTEYDIKARSELDGYPAVEIEGFRDPNRTFGSVRCYPIMLNNKVKGALISAGRSHYGSTVVEIIAPVFLRKHLGLKDGHKVKVEVLTAR
jgi:riboflavin kinase